MFKSKLQEYCQSKKWNLPEYSTTREGLDHCPQFKATVTVNGSTFTTPNPSKSSKEAHNLVANIAYQHLTGSPSANNALQVSPTSVDAQQPKMNEPLQAATVSDVNFSSRDDKKFKDMAHLYKNQLQIYAQKKNINLPVYISEREGPPHACRFKSKVMLEEKTYESFEFFSTIKDAENAAAKAALMSVSSDETEEEDPGFFKNLLQELAQKEYSCLPAYVTTRSGPSHYPIFSSTVEINEESFTGQEAKTKKLAEMNAAKVAYIAMKERKGKPNFKPDSLSYHVNDAPPKSQFVPIADLSDKHILAPDPISNRAHMDLVNCNKGAYHQDTVAEQTGGKPEVHTNFDQNNCGLKLDNSSGQNSSSAPIQSPSRSGVRQIDQPSPSSGVMSSHKKIKVYPVTPNMTLPTGATVMHRDEKWVAMSMDSIHGNV
ncbi:double-stranded RNA-binding protein 1 isoform X2 [Chenopodium quinoa]|uniref:double-stranded RNA-binding protein 1 isoform X2 n=1 Tax=Chenopodium quinoa TaxID=63459 RepID=UPI000B793D82|nr:double-stranded RNA-binding protein 1 isoform X2 [Chenopodium quinoa]